MAFDALRREESPDAPELMDPPPNLSPELEDMDIETEGALAATGALSVLWLLKEENVFLTIPMNPPESDAELCDSFALFMERFGFGMLAPWPVGDALALLWKRLVTV